jgi:hypothetical protein
MLHIDGKSSDSRNSSYASAFVVVVQPRQSLLIMERELSHPQQGLGFEALAEQELTWRTEASSFGWLAMLVVRYKS